MSQICIFNDEEQHAWQVRYSPVILVLSTARADLLCSCVDDLSNFRQFCFLFRSLSRSHQFNSMIESKHFASQTILNNRGMITEIRSYIFR